MTVRRSDRLCTALRASLTGGRPRPPEGELPIWNAFAALSRQRGAGMAGPNPIAFQEIEAWCRLTRTPFEPHHVRMILALDAVWLEHASERSRPLPDGVKALPPISAQGMTPQLFDTLL